MRIQIAGVVLGGLLFVSCAPPERRPSSASDTAPAAEEASSEAAEVPAEPQPVQLLPLASENYRMRLAVMPAVPVSPALSSENHRLRLGPVSLP